MVAVFPAVHQDDRQRIEAVGAQTPELRQRRLFIQRQQNRAVAADTLGNLHHARRKLLGQHDVTREDIGPRLRADPQRVAESPW